MKDRFRIMVLAVFLLLCAGAAHAAAEKWEFDRVHSSIFFDVKHIYATVRGHFEDYTGTFLFDPTGKEESRCEIEVEVKSINTYIRKRDNHLRSDDFFSAGKYPLMTFKSTGIKHVEGNRYTIDGKFTLKDVTKDVVVPFVYYGMKENPLNPQQLVAGFEARFTIDRLEYNVGSGKFYKMGVIGKDVDITISLEMLREK